MSETKLPAIPAVAEQKLLDVARAIKQILDVREGKVGDPLDANVTFRDLVNSGVASFNGSFGGWTSGGYPILPPGTFGDGYDPTTDLSIPPKPDSVTATGLFASVQIQWDAPTYRNHAYAEVWRSSTDVIGNAVRIGTTETRFFVDYLGTSATRFYWVRFVSQANITGPYHATSGASATTATDPALVLASLSGQIRESHLFESLSSRIDLIDAPSTVSNSVNSRIAVVQGQVNDLLNIPSWSSTETYSTNDQVTYNGSLYRALQTSTNVLPTNATFWQKIGDYTSLGDAVAAHTTQISNLEDDLGQEVVDRTALAVQLRGNYTGNDLSLVSQGLIFQERTARANADSALATSVETVSALANSKTRVFYQNTAPTSNLQVNDIWVDTKLTFASDYFQDDYSIKSNRMYRWDGSNWIEAVDYGFADTFSAINIEKISRVDADQALSTQITTLFSNFESNRAAITQEQSTRATADSALASSITSLSSQVNNPTTGLPATRATLLNDYYTKTGTDNAISSATTALTSTFNNTLASYVTTASLTANYYTKTDTDQAISSASTTLTSSFNNTLSSYATTAAVQQNYFAKASGESLQAQFTVKTDLAGRVAGFGLASESTTAGVSTSQFAIIADRFSISAPNDYTQESTPTSGVTEGKVWYRPSTKQTLRYDGSQWVAFDPVFPFAVQATPTTIGNVAVPAGVYMDAAFIKNGTITNAKIANAAIDNAKIANLDAAKINTGTLSADLIAASSITADKIGAGQIAASGDITIGGTGPSAPLVLSPSGEIISNGSGGDKARFFSGNVEIYKAVPNVGSVVYKALSRVEFGVADNNTPVTIPGYFKTQPRIIVSPANLQLYAAAYSNQNQSIQVRADNISESSSGSMVWSFTPVATLSLAANTGSNVINQTSGAISTSWTSSEYTTPSSTTNITPSVTLASSRGTGTAGNFFRRSVRWRVEYWNGSSWILGSWTTVALSDSVSASTTSSAKFTFPSAAAWKFRIYAEAFDTGGTFTTGTQYETRTDTASRADYQTRSTTNGQLTLNYSPTYSVPSGWELTGVTFSYRYSYAVGASGSGASASLTGGGLFIVSGSGTNLTRSWSTSSNSLVFTVTANAGSGSAAFPSGATATVELFSATGTYSIRRPLTNSTTASNSFSFNSYAFELTSAQVLATGSLNWVAIGD